MRSSAGTPDFTARVSILGPQWITIDGKQYQCLTPLRGNSQWFVATSQHDHQLYRVEPYAERVEEILIAAPCMGELLRPERQLNPEFIIQTIAEAWLFALTERFSIEHYARYVVLVWIPAGLIHPDDLTAALLQLLTPYPVLAEELREVQNDQSGSPRLRSAWVNGLATLAATRTRHYEQA